ncbi:hypothetical protein MWU60_01875 [Yoonia sp. F2084L]|uniref:hypothetical protein n=1 Tax=Yoonia sp. F2084L TaxID=2926419 RepID=UPI001FF5EEF3|nr:hypothetical protein [Yoonia sp. F2084L]MCK0094305.1 hypothetical protein [Yoonia sp. F2084L]
MDSMIGLRIMFTGAILGAGVVGALTLFAPHVAGRYVFCGATVVDSYLRILGALWLSLGLVAGLGLLRPMDFLPVLLIQVIYKSAWLATVAYPAIVQGNRDTGLLFLAGLFTIWVAALSLTIPFSRIVAGY